MIQHLSFPMGNSVNDFIDPELATVQYTSFDKVLSTISKLGKGAEMARMDIQSAFRLIILHPDDFELFGFSFKGQYFYDKCLPFGCSASCSLFEKLACFLEYLVRFQSGKDSIEHYLDDYLLVASEPGECLQLMNIFRTICLDIGVPLAEEKTLGPSCILIFLGIEIDTIERVIRIPKEKLIEVKEKLEFTLCKKKVTLRELQSLVGSLNFCAKAIPSVRAFNRRFCDAMCGVQMPNHHIRVSEGMKEDILTWLSFLENFNGTCEFVDNKWLTNDQLDLYSDSAGSPDLGCGTYFGGRWCYFPWPDSWKNPEVMADITFLELVPIVLSIFLFEKDLRNKRILFHTDNMSLVSILNKKSSKSKRVMELVRPFVLHTMLNNMQFKALHVEGRFNSISDSISRKQWDRLNMLAPEAEREPMLVPDSFYQLISRLRLVA